MIINGRSYGTHSSHPAVAMPITEATEEELLAAAMQYNDAALGELYDRYEARIYSYVFRRTGDQTLAEDLTAQVFLKMLESIRDRKAWHSSFSGWLYRIAHNLVIDHYRRRDRQSSVDLEDGPPMASELEDPVATAELYIDAERLRSAIRRLTDEQAEVVSLRFLEGYSIAEVAAMTNRTEGAIKALQYRAVATLRTLLYDQLH
jgi:RNA polymerase sigma-70 factor (ECF subfamily)